MCHNQQKGGWSESNNHTQHWILKNAQRALSEVMQERKVSVSGLAGKKWTLLFKFGKQELCSWKASCNGLFSYIEPHKISGIICEGFSKITAKTPQGALYEMYVKPWQCWYPELAMVAHWWECLFSLKSFQRPCVSETGLLMDTSRRRSATSWDPKQLRILFMFTPTAK